MGVQRPNDREQDYEDYIPGQELKLSFPPPRQAPDRSLARQPLIPPSRTLLTHARFPPSVTPRRDHELIGDNGNLPGKRPH